MESFSRKEEFNCSRLVSLSEISGKKDPIIREASIDEIPFLNLSNLSNGIIQK